MKEVDKNLTTKFLACSPPLLLAGHVNGALEPHRSTLKPLSASAHSAPISCPMFRRNHKNIKRTTTSQGNVGAAWIEKGRWSSSYCPHSAKVGALSRNLPHAKSASRPTAQAVALVVFGRHSIWMAWLGHEIWKVNSQRSYQLITGAETQSCGLICTFR